MANHSQFGQRKSSGTKTVSFIHVKDIRELERILHHSMTWEKYGTKFPGHSEKG
jgi:hypothetical protein